MADVLSVIADIIKQDKQQKREHAKVMREVQKKLKEKETDASEDVSDFMGAASQAAADGKKEFEFPPGSGKMYPVTIKDKDTAKKIAKKMDDKDEKEDHDDGDKDLSKVPPQLRKHVAKKKGVTKEELEAIVKKALKEALQKRKG